MPVVSSTKEGYVFDVAYTSVLKRAIKTLWLALEEMDLMWISVYRSFYLGDPQVVKQATKAVPDQ